MSSQLEQLKGVVEVDDNELKPLKPKSDNKFLTSSVIGGIVIVVFGLAVLIITLIKRKEKKNKY